MIRLNAFFEVKDNASIEAVKNPGTELVNKSRNDEGCVSYDLFTSATRPLVMMFCETWKDEEVLKAHIASAHFTDLVPKIEALTKNGRKLEKFEFEIIGTADSRTTHSSKPHLCVDLHVKRESAVSFLLFSSCIAAIILTGCCTTTIAISLATIIVTSIIAFSATIFSARIITLLAIAITLRRLLAITITL